MPGDAVDAAGPWCAALDEVLQRALLLARLRGDDLAARLPGREQDEHARARSAAGTSRRGGPWCRLAREEGEVDGAGTPRPPATDQPQRLVPRARGTTTKNRIVSIASVPVTAMPYAAARRVEEPKPTTSATTATKQHPVDGGHVDLADLVRGGVADRAAAAGSRAARPGGSPRTRRRSRPATRSPSPASRGRPSGSRAQCGNSRKNGFATALGVGEDQRALAEVVEDQRREDDDEPRAPDRRAGRSDPCRRRAPRRR